MGCAASTGSSTIATPLAQHHTTYAPAAATPTGEDEEDDSTKDVARAAAHTKRPANSFPVSAADLVSGSLLLLSIACEASPLPGGAVVAAVLKSIYTVFNSAASKQLWIAEFMVYLRNIEIDLCAADAAFQSRDFCAQLALRLERTRSIVADITDRGTVTSALAANMDEESLKQERTDLEALKQTAMMTMMNSVKHDTQSIDQQAKNALLLAAGGPATAAASAVAASSSVAVAASKPSNDTASSVPASVTAGLDMLATVPNASGPIAQLLSILDMIDAARSRTEWLDDFAAYLRAIQSDLADARSVFKQSSYYDQLAERITKTRSLVVSIISRNRFIAMATASGDRAALLAEKSALEKIKSTALASQLTAIKADTNSTKQIVDEIQQALRISDELETKLQAARAAMNEHDAMVSKLMPISFEADINRELKKFMDGTRKSIITAVDAWMNVKADASRAASDDVSSLSRVFWLKGDPGAGKSCLSAVLCDRYSTDIIGVHFCRHDELVRKDARRMIRSIAYQIAQRLPAYSAALKAVLPAVFANGVSISAADLWQQLLVDPLHSCSSELSLLFAASGRKFVILIDALDEAGATTSSAGASELLDVLASSLAALPSFIGVLVTSRPEEAIVRKLKKYRPMELTCESAENLHDVRVFIRHFIASSADLSILDAAADLLLKKSGGLILCARLMLQSHGLFADDLPLDWDGRLYIDQPLTMEELSKWSSGLDDFFFSAMNRAREKIESVKGYKKVNHFVTGESVPVDLLNLLDSIVYILGSYEPLSLECIASMSRLPSYESLIRLLAPVRSLFPITVPVAADPARQTLVLPPSATVSVYHKSVKDYFISPNRRSTIEELIYSLPAEVNHQMMAERCFDGLLRPSDNAASKAASSNDAGRSNSLAVIRSQHASVVQSLDPSLRLPFAPLLRVAELPSSAAHIESPPLFDERNALFRELPTELHPEHATKGPFAAMNFFEDWKATCSVCKEDAHMRGAIYSCAMCAGAAVDKYLEYHAQDQSNSFVPKYAGTEYGAMEYENHLQATWSRTKLATSICTKCAEAPVKALFAKCDAEIVDAKAAAQQVYLSQFPAAHSILSYAIRRGAAHALDSGSLVLVAAFLCHLDYWRMRLAFAGEATTLEAELRRAVDERASLSYSSAINSPQHAWIASNRTVGAPASTATWLR